MKFSLHSSILRTALALALLPVSCLVAQDQASGKLRALLVDGRNNHDWRSTTDALRAILEATGRFDVTVSTAPEIRFPRVPRRAPRAEEEADLAAARSYFEAPLKEAEERARSEFASWAPDFGAADLVVLNYNGGDWPEEVRESFLDYVRGGGGVVLIHGANNAFRNWTDFNEMIGLGWRPAPVGRAIKIDPESGKPYVADDRALPNEGNSSHGSKHPFAVTVRAPEHPVMEGVPPVWMHASDELYHNMRGPAKNMTVLSSAYSDPKQRGTGLHEPITWEVAFEKGRVIVTSMGHLWPGGMDREEYQSLYCLGFQAIFARSCEYVATGEVTLPIPDGFPGPEEVYAVSPFSVSWPNNTKPGDEEAMLSMRKKKETDPYSMLTPEEQLTTFEIAPGFVAELFASEPMVQEPVLTVWDADGAMYVAEMRSYMQNVSGEGTKTMKNGRVKRLVDEDGDGRADAATVFVDNLNLPRAILPLADGWIAIRETDSMDVIAWRDTDGDGVADESKALYEGGRKIDPGKSVEHQDSGLMWNLDNNIYITYHSEHYRFTTGEWQVFSHPGHWTQWGLTHDDVGDLFWVTNTAPLAAAYIRPKYWQIPYRFAERGSVPRVPVPLPPPHDQAFLSVHSSCLLNDRGGSASEVRSFTSACGQSIYRADKFPADARGNYFVVDPTIHVVRRAHVSKPGGLVHLAKAEPEGEEFLRSSDINCRFVNTAEGPDGCLYVTDMYRGIIQDAPWLNPQSRENIVAAGLDKNVQRGRIWWIRHRDFKPREKAEMPPMSGESTIALLRHLESESGWWRDTAQREILLREDRESVVPHLKGIARFGENALGRLHALWTLDGMGEADVSLLSRIVHDRDFRLRRAAVQIAEPRLGEAEVFDAVVRPLEKERDALVAKQLVLSLGLVREHTDAIATIEEICRRHGGSAGVRLAATLSLWGMTDLPLVTEIENGKAFDAATNLGWQNSMGNWKRGLKFPEEMATTERRRIEGGETLYFQNCVSCHGVDGTGIGIPGTDMKLAPSLVDSSRLRGDPSQLIPVFHHGLMGPIDGKTYQAGFMAPVATMGITRDDRLSELITYLRFVFGEGGSSVSKEEVESVRRKHNTRTAPWTDEELKALGEEKP